MAQGAVNIALGCNYLTDNGNIDIDAGIFGALTEEILTPVLKGIILPAINNTACKYRRTRKCDVNCPKAVTVFQCGTHWSPQNRGKRM